MTYTSHTISSPSFESSISSTTNALRIFAAKLVKAFSRWHDRRAQYMALRQLRQLGHGMLKDIGLDRSSLVSAAIQVKINELRRERRICSALINQ